MNRQIFIQLRKVLASLYQNVESIRRVCEDAEIDLTLVALNSAPLDNWNAVLGQAQKSGQVDGLLAIIWSDYEKNQELQKVYEAYRQSIRLDPTAYALEKVDISEADSPQATHTEPLGKDQEEIAEWFFEHLQPDAQSLLLSVALFQGMARHKIMDIVFDIEEILS